MAVEVAGKSSRPRAHVSIASGGLGGSHPYGLGDSRTFHVEHV